MRFVKDNWRYILLIGIICIMLFRECAHPVKIIPGKHTIDTVFIEKPYIPKKIIPNNTPVKVCIYRDKDTTLRNIREKQSIIEKVDINGSQVAITTIDTAGVIKTDIHIIEPDSHGLSIDNTGQLEEKKKTRAGKIIKKVWKGAKTGLMVVGGAAVFVLVAKNF